MPSQRHRAAAAFRLRLIPRVLALHICLATAAAGGLGGTAWAQAPAPAAQYDIPAGPLADALGAFARQAGVALSMDAAALAGQRTQGLKGSYGVDEGFTALLRGSGHAVSKTASGGYALAPTPTAAAPQTAAARGSAGPADVTLPAVTVTDQAELSAHSEGTGSYAARAASIDKTARKLKEIPQSISVVAGALLKDQNTVSLEEALKNVTGLTVQRFDAAGIYNIFNARGFGSDTYQLDGLTVQTDANGVYLDLAAFDRVEVMRGAAGMYSGAGEPGVTINMARKRALAPFHIDAGLSAGSWKNYRTDLDVTGALTESGRVRGRVVAALQDYDTFMNNVNGGTKMVSGTLEFDLTDKTTLSLGASYQDVRSILSRGLPSWADGRLIDMPRSTAPVYDWNRQRLETTSYFAELEHRLDNDALFKFALRRQERTNEAKYVDPSPPARDGTMSALTSSAFARDDTDSTVDLYFSTPWHWAGRTHNLLLGADYRETDNQTNYAPYSGLVVRSHLFHHTPFATPAPLFNLNTNVSRAQVRSHGMYTQLRVKPTDALTLIAGGRWSWWHSYSTSNTAQPSTYEANGQFTPYAGAVLELTPSLSAYASYSEIFKPQNSLTFGGEQIKPRIGNQVEVGLKGEAMDGRVNYSGALYQLKDENRALSDIAHEGFFIASGKVRSQGFEAEIRGDISREWSLSAGYAYNDTKYLKATASQQGRTFSTFTPRHNLNLWTHYKFPEGAWAGLGLGAGVRAVSSFYSESGTITVRAPGYSVASMLVAYRFSPRLKLSLNVDNLFDKTYWEKVSYPGRQNFFGSPRSVTLSLRASF